MNIKKIQSIEDIQTLVALGHQSWDKYGNVRTSYNHDRTLIIFNYTAKATYSGEFNYFESVSRGLIVNCATGEIAARPFDKFFNWGQGDRYTTSKIKSVHEKMDGSLGILYRDRGVMKVATRGSFDSDQAVWATDYLPNNVRPLAFVPNDATALVEIIYPDNRIVVDYEGESKLVLLAVRNRFNGKYYDAIDTSNIAYALNLPMPGSVQFDDVQSVADSLERMTGNEEGWVVEFESGERFKFKGQEYLRMHRLIHNLSFKRVLDCHKRGVLDELGDIPDEFRGQVDDWVEGIYLVLLKVFNRVGFAFAEFPGGTRKEFALWVSKNHSELSPYLFAMFDGKPITPIIYKREFKKGVSDE